MNVLRIEWTSENQYFSNWNSIGLYWSRLLNQKEKALIGRSQTALSPVMTRYQFWLYTDKSSRKLDVRFFLLAFLAESYFLFLLLLTSDPRQWIIKFSRVKSTKTELMTQKRNLWNWKIMEPFICMSSTCYSLLWSFMFGGECKVDYCRDRLTCKSLRSLFCIFSVIYSVFYFSVLNYMY